MNDGAITFVVMGTLKYYPLLTMNLELIRAQYPDAAILVYDWGGPDFKPHFIYPGSLVSDPKGQITVIDWGYRIQDTSALEADLTPAQRVDVAIKFNARFQRTLGQRIRKKILKLAPNSLLAKPMITAGLRFENMLMQKIPCMQDASSRVGAGRMVFLDADAFLLQRFDELLIRADYDVAVTLIEKPCFDLDKCAIVNSGVIFFGPKQTKRDLFLAAWHQASLTCREWLKEQTALARMLESAGPGFLVENTVNILNGIAILSLPQRIYNNTDHACLNQSPLPKIAHLANTAHNDKYFKLLQAKVRQASKSGE